MKTLKSRGQRASLTDKELSYFADRWSPVEYDYFENQPTAYSDFEIFCTEIQRILGKLYVNKNKDAGKVPIHEPGDFDRFSDMCYTINELYRFK